MSANELLFEIGTEEIPAGFLARALVDLEALAAERLKAARLEFGEVTTLGAPRRLALSVKNLAERQADVSETVTGPPASAAFDKEGKPTRAAIGFAAKNGVPVEALVVVEVPGKGAYITARREQKGEEARALLPRLLVELTRAIPWKKSMRWASFDESFARPVHWIVALYRGEVVPISLHGVKSGRETRGHRFLAPGAVALDGTLEDYRRKLREAFVIVDQHARRREIEAELARVGKEQGVRVRSDDELLAEVTNLVEYPRAIVGSFDEKFLAIPPEVVVSEMKVHQRYFATEKADGSLANRFVTIAGTVTKDPAIVARGNERVLAARLSDASFFHEEDLKASFEAWGEKLRGVVFQNKLGTIAEKIDRIVANQVVPRPRNDEGGYEQAARACKADLVSKMVGEFPELQGVMGRHYAKKWGLDDRVADAIFEHYLPRGASDALPKGELGAAIGVADRMDTIVGCFAVGLQPTGSADAFGLRRAALAVLNILLERSWPVTISQLVDEAARHLSGKVTVKPETRAAILEFFKVRMRGLFVEQKNVAADSVDAALAAGFDDARDALVRATALQEVPEEVKVTFKRVANILKGEAPAGAPDAGRFVHDSERRLWEAFQGLSFQGDTRAALAELGRLKPAVDRFFDDVLVMDPDAAVKQNRLNLLGTINSTFMRIADFRLLAVK